MVGLVAANLDVGDGKEEIEKTEAELSSLEE
jgi:hypothetical protein